MNGFRKKLELRKRLGVKYVRVRAAVPAKNGMDVSGVAESPHPAYSTQGVNKSVKATIPSRVEPACGERPKGVEPNSPSRTSGQSKVDWCLGEGPKAETLRAFCERIKDCQDCPLGKTRRNFVFGMGNPDAKVVFVGEAPGADEDAQGLPFVGRAGQLLTKIIASTKAWKREEVFIANVLKCRPPGNRQPLPEEVAHCLPHLKEQIRIIQPLLLMALGASAAQSLLSTKAAVGKLRNMWHEVGGIPLRVTYHPAALLRFEGYKKDVFEDMKVFTNKYREFTGS
jgi:uracil-DNA glycosylase family 4